MKQRNSSRGGMGDLRDRAEKRLSGKPGRRVADSADGPMKQLHELQVHQIELEMQNQELHRIREEVEAGLVNYTILYDFAPVGYFTLDRLGKLTKLNLHGATLLRSARSDLMNRSFMDFVPAASQETFHGFLERVFSSGTPETLELELLTAGAEALFAHIEAVADEDTGSCRAVVVDITARRHAEQRADELLRQNRALNQRMFKAQETERRELARELHDELGQWLTAIQAEAEAIRGGSAVTNNTRLVDSVDAIRNSAGELHRGIRRILRRLRPTLLDSLGLAESLRELIAQWSKHQLDTSCDLELDGDFSCVPEPLAIMLYRVVQEALTNVARHAGARRVLVALQLKVDDNGRPRNLVLEIEDDGIGLDPAATPTGLGLMGMRERAIAFNGEFSLHSKPREGLRIAVRVPLPVAGSGG